MSMDVELNKGILVDWGTMLRLLDKCERAELCMVIKNYINAFDKDSEDYHNLQSSLGFIDKTTPIEDIRKAFSGRITGGDLVEEELWNKILEIIDKDLPKIEYIWGFERGFHNEHEGCIPFDEARFAFESSECFTKQLTPTGERLKNVVGHCDESTWSYVSI